jgi:hypothetical protein
MCMTLELEVALYGELSRLRALNIYVANLRVIVCSSIFRRDLDHS